MKQFHPLKISASGGERGILANFELMLSIDKVVSL
jgi:hypothetical protein